VKFPHLNSSNLPRFFPAGSPHRYVRPSSLISFQFPRFIVEKPQLSPHGLTPPPWSGFTKLPVLTGVLCVSLMFNSIFGFVFLKWFSGFPVRATVPGTPHRLLLFSLGWKKFVVVTAAGFLKKTTNPHKKTFFYVTAHGVSVNTFFCPVLGNFPFFRVSVDRACFDHRPLGY